MSVLSAVLREADKASAEERKKLCNDLVLRIRDLTERTQLLTFTLHQNFVDTYINYAPTKSLEQLNYKNRKANIISDYTQLFMQIENLRQNYFVTEEEFIKSSQKLRECIKLHEDLSLLVESKSILDKASHEFGRYNYSDAILSLKELQSKMKNIKLEDKLSKGLDNLENQIRNQLAFYAAYLSTEWEDIFSWTEKESVSYLTYSLTVLQVDSTLTHKILKSLYVTGRLNYELGAFSHFFMDKLLHNVIQHNCTIFTEDESGALVFNIKFDLNDNKKPNYHTIFNNLTAIFEFLENTLGSLFDCDKKFLQVFAESIHEKFFSKVIEDCIKNNLPSCPSSYKDYLEMVAELDCFNNFLIDIKFVEASKSPLNKYISDTESVLYDKKCDRLLSEIRTLLSQSITYGSVEVGVSPTVESESLLDVSQKEIVWDLNNPIFLPKCVISENVKKIMSLIVEHLEQSVKLPEKYRKQLVLYIKDIAVMYQCLVPQKFKTSLESCPFDIALFFNNCFYLAHGLVGPPWKITLPAELADLLITVLLESIQDLRTLALEKISLYLQKQKEFIMHNVESRDAVDPLPWTTENYDKFDSAINEAIILLKDLKTSWHNVLPQRMYEMSMCTLIQSLCQSVLVRVFSNSNPINEAHAYMIATRLQNTISDIRNLFAEPIQYESKISAWAKFIKLPQLLKAQLMELSDLWTEGCEVAQSYSCEEIRQIVKMRFPDDKYRLKILNEIQ